MKKQMNDSSNKKNFIHTDWVKTCVAIIIQSVAVGYYLASVQSDVAYLTKDFQEFKGRMEGYTFGINSKLDEVTSIRIRLSTITEEMERNSKRVQFLEDRLVDLRDQFKDSLRDIQTLRDRNGNNYSPKKHNNP